jgi:hypothetical protein
MCLAGSSWTNETSLTFGIVASGLPQSIHMGDVCDVSTDLTGAATWKIDENNVLPIIDVTIVFSSSNGPTEGPDEAPGQT